MDGEGAQSIYQPHSLCKEAVQHPVGPAADVSVPLSRWQEGEQAMQGVMRVPNDGGSPSYAVLLVELHQKREVCTNNSAGSFNNLVQLLLSLSPAAAKLGREAVLQEAFIGAPVKCDEVGVCLTSSPGGVETLLCLLNECCGVDGEGWVISQVYTEELLNTVDPLHSSTIVIGDLCQT